MAFRKLWLPVAVLALNASAKTYHADCSGPCPGAGTSDNPFCSLEEVNKPTFQPGDIIAFKSGTVCTGILSPKGSGKADDVITITKYATSSPAANPLINGTGAVAAVTLTNQDYWTISNLTVTNPGSPAERQGIQVIGTDNKTHSGIFIDSNIVHHVAGWSNKDKSTTGGKNIGEFSRSCGISIDVPRGTGRFDNVLVQNNEVTDCGGGGIKVRVGIDLNKGNNTHVTKNKVLQCGGDGIVLSYANGPMVDYNTASDLGKGAYPWTGGNFAGMWAYRDHNPTFAHNIVYGSIMSVSDSEAFDCDVSNTGDCTIEYNFSRDNAGGAFLNCDNCEGSTPTSKSNQVVRYNIFQNDCRIINGNKSNRPKLYFYQNVVYCPNKDFQITPPTNAEFTNNIFVGNGKSTLPTGGGIKWNYNVFHNVSNPGVTGIMGDPEFVDPGRGANTLDSAVGYRLKKSSPTLKNGAIIPGNGELDFFGGHVSTSTKPNRGAYNGDGL